MYNTLCGYAAALCHTRDPSPLLFRRAANVPSFPIFPIVLSAILLFLLLTTKLVSITRQVSAVSKVAAALAKGRLSLRHFAFTGSA